MTDLAVHAETVATFDHASRVQRAMRRIAAASPSSWFAIRFMHRIDQRVFRLTRGKHTALSLLSGLPVVLLTTTGARSGQQRTTPVLGFPTSDGLVVIASNYGQARHPAWYHNLRAHPDGEVSLRGRSWRFCAVEAEGELRDRIWQQGLTIYPGWAAYEKRAPNRRIGIFVLQPESARPREGTGADAVS